MGILGSKLRASGWHLLFSALCVMLAAALVYWVWYPAPYPELSEIGSLFLMLVGIDLLLGPALSLFVYHPNKSRRALLFDYTVIGLFQIGALCYGLYTCYDARPVALVFEKNLLRVVHANDIPRSELPVSLSRTGPVLRALQLPEDQKQREEIMFSIAMSGQYEAYYPKYWASYESQHAQISAAAQPLTQWLQRFPQAQQQTQAVLDANRLQMENLLVLPVIGRDFLTWQALLDKQTLQPVAWLEFEAQ